MKKPRKLSFCSFEPQWAKGPSDVHPKHPLKYKECVIYLGDISNSSSHCVVIKESGQAVWMVHTSDLRELSEEET